MCIIDENCNQRYRIDYNKFIQKIQTAANAAGMGQAMPQ